MKRIAIVFLMLLPCITFCQETPRAEVFGGYAYLSFDPNGLQKQQSANGWAGSFSVNANRWLAGEFQVAGAYKSYTDLGVTVNFHDYAFLAGPRINIKYFYFHALLGRDNLTGSAFGLSASQGSFAGAAGPGIEVPINRNFAIKAGIDYLFTHHNILGGNRILQNNGLVTAGLVYRFGFHQSQQQSPRIRRSQSSGMRSEVSGMTISLLGIRVAPWELGGAEVVDVAPQSIASMSGLRVGDVINMIDGVRIGSPVELAGTLASKPSGSQVKVGYLIRGEWQTETLIPLHQQ